MVFPKRTFEKPIPISPTIALDRERCILCYRCTRFSESVAEDGQLVAVERGAASMIATFEDEPYRAPFSGNVIELCPVGALTSTQYRFEARPWEIQNVPTVCGLCPVGCNISATTREGKVKRILSRNHPEVDEGWLCDKGRFAFGHLHAADRIQDPLVKGKDGRLRAARVERRARPGRGDARGGRRDDGHRALGLRDGRAGLRPREAPPRRARRARGGAAGGGPRRPRLLPRAALLDPRREDGRRASATSPCTTARPIVDLWIKAARRNGAQVLCEQPEGKVEGAVLISDDPARAAWLAGDIGASAAFYLPRTPNGRGVADAWSAAADGEPGDAEPTLLIISGDEAAIDPGVRALAEHASAVIGIGMFEESFRGLADLVLPGTSYLERDGTTVNLEGRLQRQRRAVIAPCPDELAWIAKLAERFEVELSPHASLVFEEIAATVLRRHLARRHHRARAAPASRRGAAGPGDAAREDGGRGRGAAAADLQAALLRPGGRADAGARVPAARRRGRAGPC